jgi:hypothetical protein
LRGGVKFIMWRVPRWISVRRDVFSLCVELRVDMMIGTAISSFSPFRLVCFVYISEPDANSLLLAP